MSLSTRMKDDVVIIELSGRLTLGEPTAELRNAVKSQLESGTRKFVIDLGDVSYIGSAGLGVLIESYTSIRNKGGDINLLNLTSRVRGLMQMTKLALVFDIYDGEAAAVAALQRGQGASA